MIHPVAIGGVGGSGTRLFAEILWNFGYFMGDDLNSAHDNLLYTLLFKRQNLFSPQGRNDDELELLFSVFTRYMSGEWNFTTDEVAKVEACVHVPRPSLSPEWLQARFDALMRRSSGVPNDMPQAAERVWGWKEPNTHVFVDCFLKANPGLVYFHVVRNGLDMAFSSNQNQIATWGTLAFGKTIEKVTPKISLEYWVKVHRRILDLERNFPNRIFLINFDSFCKSPGKGLRFLINKLRIDCTEERIARIRSLVRPPPSIGRYKKYDIDQFNAEDVLFVRKLGFDAEMQGVR